MFLYGILIRILKKSLAYLEQTPDFAELQEIFPTISVKQFHFTIFYIVPQIHITNMYSKKIEDKYFRNSL